MSGISWAWAILARLTRNKAIDSIRYENAKRRGGDGGRATVANTGNISVQAYSDGTMVSGTAGILAQSIGGGGGNGGAAHQMECSSRKRR